MGSKAFQEAGDLAPDAEKRYLQVERENALREAINELRPSLSVAVELRHLAEQPIHETAETLGLSLAATKSRLFHARAALRKSQKLLTFHNTDLKTSWSCQNDLKTEATAQ
jgi:RNA polymerase sigma factor (sigma-70 family)